MTGELNDFTWLAGRKAECRKKTMWWEEGEDSLKGKEQKLKFSDHPTAKCSSSKYIQGALVNNN